jgi:hypothetical protein
MCARHLARASPSVGWCHLITANATRILPRPGAANTTSTVAMKGFVTGWLQTSSTAPSSVSQSTNVERGTFTRDNPRAAEIAKAEG